MDGKVCFIFVIHFKFFSISNRKLIKYLQVVTGTEVGVIGGFCNEDINVIHGPSDIRLFIYIYKYNHYTCTLYEYNYKIMEVNVHLYRFVRVFLR